MVQSFQIQNTIAIMSRSCVAQRARNKKRVRALHAKIANSRKDHLHKASTALVKNNALIIVGDLSARKLVKTKMAKSVLDTGFSALKTMLRYKCENAGVLFEEVNEAYTTQICSCCGNISTVVRKVGQILE